MYDCNIVHILVLLKEKGFTQPFTRDCTVLDWLLRNFGRGHRNIDKKILLHVVLVYGDSVYILIKIASDILYKCLPV